MAPAAVLPSAEVPSFAATLPVLPAYVQSSTRRCSLDKGVFSCYYVCMNKPQSSSDKSLTFREVNDILLKFLIRIIVLFLLVCFVLAML